MTEGGKPYTKIEGCSVNNWDGIWKKFCIFIDDHNVKESEEIIKQKIKKVLSKFPYEYEVNISDVPRCFAECATKRVWRFQNGHVLQISENERSHRLFSKKEK